MKLRLKRQARNARVLHGHPWVFAGEVEQLLPAKFDGTGVVLEDARGHLLGSGIYNSQSQIVWRRFSREEKAFDRSFLESALRRAIETRDEEDARRLVWSESDDLPGLVVDQFDNVLVLQALTRAMDEAMPTILELLGEMLNPEEMVVRNDAPVRSYEGLDSRTFTASGQPFEPRWFNIYEIDYFLDLQHQQKTGFYLDQRQEHFKVSTMCPGWRVLDAFCNQGAFALHAARADAREVIGIDSSAECIRLAEKNAEKNKLDVSFRCENVFDYFTANRDERFDLIVLDPPSFARNRRAVGGALRGYKELNLRALQMLTPGGILATYSCSQHVDRPVFMNMLADAAFDARRDVQVLYESGQPIDHPVRLNFPESEYLKGAILRVS